ncbi:MAG: hypothetical protein M1378_12535 [Bacteroidetes bacterium]|nr:hypothetical protein [Bacteroidota bacterium]
MGTQQLLLIVLGVVIIGIAIAVGITLFKSNAQNSDREQIIGDLDNLGSSAQQFYRKPKSFAGGGRDFQDFEIAPLETGNRNGSYSVTTTEPTDPGYVPGNRGPLTDPTQLFYIVGCGKELGNNGVDPIKAYVIVTKDSLEMHILN